jgi:ElaB/YqjD/DUF883 family membrane-anchored ribosome-binding protein
MAERNDLTGRTGQTAERSSEQIRQDIVAKRETISSTVDRLSERLQEKFDWRGYVTRYPYAAMGAAAGVGFVASALLFRRRRGPVEKVVDSMVDAVEDLRGQVSRALGSMLVRSKGGRSVIRGAIGTAVSKAAVDMVKKMATRGDGFQRSGVDDSRLHWSTSPKQEPSSSGTLT